MLIVRAASASDLTAMVNLELDNGKIMIYKGSADGVRLYDEFEVIIGNKPVGRVRVNKVDRLYSLANVIVGRACEGCLLIRVPPQQPGYEAPPQPGMVIPKKKVKKETEKTIEKPAPEEEEKKVSSSKRRRQREKEIEKEDEEEPEIAKEEPPRKREDRDKKPKKAPPAEVKEERKEQLDSLTATAFLGQSTYGLTGLIFTPTSSVVPSKRGFIHFTYADNQDDNDDVTGFKDKGFALTFGLGKGIEASVGILSTDLRDPAYISDNIDVNFKTEIFSIKWLLKTDAVIPVIGNSDGNGSYAAGVQQFRQTIKLSGNVSPDQTTKGTYTTRRIFIVGSGKMSTSYAHIGGFYQEGSLVDYVDHDGFGVIAGIEHPLEQSEFRRISLVLDYDSSPYYLDSDDNFSAGIRYINERTRITAGIADIYNSKFFMLNGGFEFD